MLNAKDITRIWDSLFDIKVHHLTKRQTQLQIQTKLEFTFSQALYMYSILSIFWKVKSISFYKKYQYIALSIYNANFTL